MKSPKELERIANAIKQGKVYHLFNDGPYYITSFFTESCARTVAQTIGAKVVYLTNH